VITIQATVEAPEACYTGSATDGAPAGAPPVERAVAVTVTLTRAAGMCAQVVTPVSVTLTTAAPDGTQAVILYIVNAAVKRTTLRALALPPRGDALALPPLTLVGTPWVLISLGDKAVSTADTAKPATLMLQESPERFVGSAGCNSMGGSYTLDGATLKIGPVTTTRLACARGLETEKAYLAALDRARGWRIVGRRLELLDESGQVIARFQALSR
jgi:heat shock protein HslJ